ncbi:MAG: MoxR family ATPase [Bacteroidetes bacterium]|nr:MoxR family ATPase [Bacteroidota bacterium]
MDENSTFETSKELKQIQDSVQQIKDEIGKIIVGQEQMIENMIIALLCEGHVLVEGMPGIAKTLTANLLANTVKADFKRIQFTPDLMPSDILGTNIFNSKTSEFEFKKGPIFSNLVLIDEINRAPAKTQAALFECMEEKQVTIDGISYELKAPFLILATQNPIDLEGTYQLPEAQLDRFMMKITVDYPSREEEKMIITNHHNREFEKKHPKANAVIEPARLMEHQKIIASVTVKDELFNYIAALVDGTRNNPSLFLGASPRASIALLECSKALAAIRGRNFVTPEDIKEILTPVLNHRVVLTPEKELEGLTPADVIEQIVQSIEVPRG